MGLRKYELMINTMNIVNIMNIIDIVNIISSIMNTIVRCK